MQRDVPCLMQIKTLLGGSLGAYFVAKLSFLLFTKKLIRKNHSLEKSAIL